MKKTPPLSNDNMFEVTGSEKWYSPAEGKSPGGGGSAVYPVVLTRLMQLYTKLYVHMNRIYSTWSFLWTFCVIMLWGHTSDAQRTLTLQEAIQTGLEKNFSIHIAQKNVEIAQQQNNPGNAGTAPVVSLTGYAGVNASNTRQKFTNGTVENVNGATSQTQSGGVDVVWTVFDGKYGKTIRTRLGRQEELSRLALRSAMEETVYQIIIAYYDVTRIQALIKATESNMELYAERKKIASVKYQVGKEAKSDYLITQSDENKIHTALLQLELQRRQALIKLNALCSLPADDNWYASDSLTIAGTSTLDTLLQTRITGNMAFQMAQQHVYIIDETIKESLAKKYPVVQLSGELSAGRGLSQSGFLRSYQQAGVAGGVTLNWSLYNGDRNNRLIQERKIQLLQQQLVTDWTQQQVQASVHNNDVTWRLNKQMLELEIANKEVAQEMIDISQERYRQGKTTILETKEAQKNWEDAQMHSIEALYRIKVAEVTILKEVGELIK